MTAEKESNGGALFALAVLASALLLFSVEPLVAKLLLPLLGGTAAVWTACMVFFQVALLAGYLYAHFATKLLGLRRQTIVHIVLLAASILALPIGLPAGVRPDEAANPFLTVLLLLARSVGIPFFLLSANTPMLSRWYAEATKGRDPYVLYAASNAGSMVALFGYPLLIEPRLRLATQTLAWSVGFGLLAALLTVCALVTRQRAATKIDEEKAVSAPPTWPERLRWVALAAVPSSLLLGVTNYLTVDVAPMPLLWVLPLALYLLTFVVVFSPSGPKVHPYALRAATIALVFIGLLFGWPVNTPPMIALGAHLLAFAIIALALHGELARRKPDVAHLTELYLWMSVGGVVGGLFNGLLAPILFDRAIEYPLVLGLAAALRTTAEPPEGSSKPRDRVLDVLLPLVGLLVVFGLAKLPGQLHLAGPLFASIAIAFVAMRSFDRALRFGGLIAVMVFAAELRGGKPDVLGTARSFFGVHRIDLDETGRFVRLGNGTTTHGKEWRDPARPREPLWYFHRKGPLGSVFAVADGRKDAGLRVGIVGLGMGSSACYDRPGDHFTFFEIDPKVVAIAKDRRYFSSLSLCAPDARIVLGDARLSLVHEPEAALDVLVLDAFSSDAIPAHLLTAEAFGLYAQKLAPNGVIALHISNRYLDLRPVVAAGGAANGLVVFARTVRPTEAEQNEGWGASTWTALARRPEDLGEIATNPAWQRVEPTKPPWTDDFSNIVSVLDWTP